MADEPRFRKDLYEGTAEYYDRFRPPYPTALFDDLRARVPLGPTSTVLDLACGTGQIAFGLSAAVGDVLAVDQEAGSVAFAARKAERLGVTNIRWVAGSAEDVELDGTFDVVAIGNAFHRIDRNAVAQRFARRLADGGCIAVLWGDTPTQGERPWQRVLRDLVERWMDALGSRELVPAGWEGSMVRDPHDQVLRRAGLDYEGKFEFTVTERWSVESLIGFLYSTSILSRRVVGEEAATFEQDLREQLLACRPDGVFEQDMSFAYELARRPA